LKKKKNISESFNKQIYQFSNNKLLEKHAKLEQTISNFTCKVVFSIFFSKFMFSEKIFERREKKLLYDFIYFSLLLRFLIIIIILLMEFDLKIM
jgi:hypothetical protein